MSYNPLLFQPSQTEQQLLLGFIMTTSNPQWRQAYDGCRPEYFDETETVACYAVIKSLVDKGDVPDVMKVAMGLRQNKSKVSPAVVSAMTSSIGFGFDWQSVLRSVEGQYKAKLGIVVGSQLSRDLVEGVEPDVALSKAKNEITLLENLTFSGNKTVSIEEAVKSETRDYDVRAANTKLGRLSGVDTGLRSLNRYLGGWQRGEVHIIAARPSMGKTAMMLFHARAAARAGHKPCIAELEMSNKKLAQRLIVGNDGTLNMTKARDGTFSEDEMRLYMQSAYEVADMPIKILDDQVSIEAIIATVRQLVAGGDCDILFIDYIQLVETLEKFNIREQQVAKISRALVLAAKELDIPIIALAQLSRDVEKRAGGKRPILSDLRESGSLEQDAAVVMFLFRGCMYGMEKDDGTPYTNECEYLLEKNRNGEVGTIHFFANDNVTTFYNHRSEIQSEFQAVSPQFPTSKALKPNMDHWDRDVNDF
jgi:replicative DNA helicase